MEVRYSEGYAGLLQPQGDGPYPFATALADTYRSHNLTVTAGQSYRAPFIQGGQRWQTLRASETATFDSIGFVPSFSTLEPDELPSHFSSSDSELNNIWRLGARTVLAACFDKGTQPTTWSTSSEGVLVQGQRPALTRKFYAMDPYTLTFESRIETGGTGWAVGFPAATLNGGLLLYIRNDSLTLGYGWSLLNQTSLPAYVLDSFPVSVREGRWLKVETEVADEHLAVTIEGQPIFNVSFSDYWIPGAPARQSYLRGSFGFGPWQDHVARYRNVQATSKNGTVLYSEALTDTSNRLLEEYGVATNLHPVCLDGAKRDRMVWLGDLYHTVRTVASSSARPDQIEGTLDYIFGYQTTEGTLPISPSMGYNPTKAMADARRRDTLNFVLQGDANIPTKAPPGSYGLLDYDVLGLLVYVRHVEDWGWSSWAEANLVHASRISEFIVSQINQTTGLVDFGGFLGPAQGSAIGFCSLSALRSFAKLSFNSTLQTEANRLEKALWGLWDSEKGSFRVSMMDGNISLAATAFAIQSGAIKPNDTEHMEPLLGRLGEIKVAIGGYLDSSANIYDPTATISPNVNGFLLEALAQAGQHHTAVDLMRGIWSRMLNNATTSTGTTWEYMSQTGQPGLSLFTSHSHPWSSAPTYVLPRYAAGLRPTAPGYAEFVVEPQPAAYNLSWATVNQKSPYGLIQVRWNQTSSQLRVSVRAPKETKGGVAVTLRNGTRRVTSLEARTGWQEVIVDQKDV
ncbi:hypothetical protein EX895_002619 [Sporisorium graminicola]|uniref:Alpha-L-rhamnosidase C-terminal domain-containing protein n=1 Tax=Sporisorium graminicola TaxID=280036 RepID=A0A4U7KVT1_9BASI|nr:hypothetical protein EX895_002619 [Sporisorium graminicola]TKY88630.1 hypothetical protein EX895_002619 [Sporisorium graminicola]